MLDRLGYIKVDKADQISDQERERERETGRQKKRGTYQ